MGLYDRGYMKDPEAGKAFRRPARARAARSPGGLTRWQRIRFKLWLAFHPGRREPKGGK